MSTRRRVTRAMMRANPVIAAWMTAALAIYVACCAVTVLAALSSRGEPRPNQIARPKRVERVQPSIGPAVTDGGRVAMWRAGE